MVRPKIVILRYFYLPAASFVGFGSQVTFFRAVLTIVISFLLGTLLIFFFQRPTPKFYPKKKTLATGSLLICRLFTTTDYNYLNSAIWPQEAGRRISPTEI